MDNGYAQINFDDVEDMYARYGMQDHGQSRYLREEVGAESIGVSLYALNAGRRTGFAHRHERVEEMYIVLAGSGRMKIDDDIVELRERDVVRVGPRSIRDFEAGPDGLELLAMGAHAAGDGETIENWWT